MHGRRSYCPFQNIIGVKSHWEPISMRLSEVMISPSFSALCSNILPEDEVVTIESFAR